MDQTAITLPYTTVTDMSGEMIKTVLEDVADNLFNPDPYYQQGGDMVRVGGLQYTIDPLAAQGKRITEMRLKGTPIDAAKTYKVAGWAPVAEAARCRHRQQDRAGVGRGGNLAQIKKRITARKLNVPRIRGWQQGHGRGNGESKGCGSFAVNLSNHEHEKYHDHHGKKIDRLFTEIPISTGQHSKLQKVDQAIFRPALTPSEEKKTYP